MTSLESKRVWVAGHKGMVGGALVRRLEVEPCDVITASRDSVDLVDQAAVFSWFEESRPELVFLAAAKVGGILANSRFPADFLYQNLMIQANLLEAAYRAGCEKVLVLGSSCIYPKHAPQPMSEDAFLTGPLEETNEAYAIAKIAGIKLAQSYRKQYGCDFISAMPTNLFGRGDNYVLQTSHVVPALLRKFHEAMLAGSEEVEVWETGAPLREFMLAEDCADALVFLMRNYSGESHINVGTGEECTIRQLAETISDVVGFGGSIRFDASKPDGTPRKLMDSNMLHKLGWRASYDLRSALEKTYEYFKRHNAEMRARRSGAMEGAA